MKNKKTEVEEEEKEEEEDKEAHGDTPKTDIEVQPPRQYSPRAPSPSPNPSLCVCVSVHSLHPPPPPLPSQPIRTPRHAPSAVTYVVNVFLQPQIRNTLRKERVNLTGWGQLPAIFPSLIQLPLLLFFFTAPLLYPPPPLRTPPPLPRPHPSFRLSWVQCAQVPIIKGNVRLIKRSFERLKSCVPALSFTHLCHLVKCGLKNNCGETRALYEGIVVVDLNGGVATVCLQSEKISGTRSSGFSGSGIHPRNKLGT